MNNPFDAIRDNPTWEEYWKLKDRDPQRINLTDLWRVAGRPRPWSPRWWRKHYHRTEEVTLEGTAADDPAWADAGTAFIYAQHIDGEIMRAVAEAVFHVFRQDPAGLMLRAPDSVKSYAAFFACASNAGGGKTAAAAAQDITAEVARRTEPLGVYAQEVKVAEVQRAFIATLGVQANPVSDGEFVQDE
jgi:hypothetical protein